jgi:hypothetical protein
MPYDLNDLAVTVTGTLFGGEVWSNSWAFKSTAPSPDPQDAVDILHEFYTFLYTNLPAISNECAAVDADARILSTPADVTVSWESVTGGGGFNLIPTECALRLSMTGVDGAKGGPFLAGFGTAGIGDGGVISSGYKAEVTSALTAMAADLVASDWTLGLRRPTVTEVEEVVSVRVGQVFDAIRRRRNDLPENYTAVVFA